MYRAWICTISFLRQPRKYKWMKKNCYLCFETFSKVTKSVSSDRKGLQQLKQAKLCHRDIKPENFLVYTTKARMLSAKFIDFNCLVDADKATGDRRAGAQLFMAPEVYFQSGFKDCYSTDIYSTGMTLYESIFRREPFKIQRAKKLGIVSGSDPKVPMSTELWTLLVSMLSPNAQYRPTVEQILANPIWKKLGWKAAEIGYLTVVESPSSSLNLSVQPISAISIIFRTLIVWKRMK